MNGSDDTKEHSGHALAMETDRENGEDGYFANQLVVEPAMEVLERRECPARMRALGWRRARAWRWGP